MGWLLGAGGSHDRPGRNKGGPFSAGSIFTAKYARWPLSSAKMAEDRWDFFVFHVHERNWLLVQGGHFYSHDLPPFFRQPS